MTERPATEAEIEAALGPRAYAAALAGGARMPAWSPTYAEALIALRGDVVPGALPDPAPRDPAPNARHRVA